MRQCTSLIVLATFLIFGSSTVLYAQGKGRGAKPATAQGPKTTVSHGPKTTSQGAKSTTRGPKTSTARGPKTTSGGTQRAASGRPAQTTAQGPNVPKSPQLQDRLRTRLGLPEGTDLTPYAADFKNQGQFIAAVNNAYNHNISFTELKNLMVNEGLSLGEAKQRLGVGENTQDAVRRPRPPQ